MNPVETIAIAKVAGKKAEKDARKRVTTGTHDTDFWLHIFGQVEVGDDYVRRVPQKACPWNLFAVALSHLNGTTIESIVREALNADPELVAAIKARADKAVAAIKGMTETTCSGRVKTDLAVEVTQTIETVKRAA
jgi:hypothetical protein